MDVAEILSELRLELEQVDREILRLERSARPVSRIADSIGNQARLSVAGDSSREEGSGGASSSSYSRPANASSSAASFDQRPAPAAAGHDEFSQSTEISDDDIPF